MRQFLFNGIRISDYDDTYMLTSTSGTDSGTVNRKETTYIDTDGMEIDEVFFQPRVIDINGFIAGQTIDHLNQAKHRLICACNPKEKTTLLYFNGSKEYAANVQPDQLPVFNKVNEKACEFTVYLNMYDFYWLTKSDIVTPVFQQKKLVKTQFTLPCVFTERTTSADVFNDGDVITYGLYEIICVAEPESDKIKIINETNGQAFTLNYTPEVGETILVDMENRRVSSDQKGNLMTYVDAQSDFIALDIGENKIVGECVGMTITSYHRCRYMGV